jgi:hypothetical protein
MPRAAERTPSNISLPHRLAQSRRGTTAPAPLEAWLSAGNPGRPRVPLPPPHLHHRQARASDDTPTVHVHRAPANSKKRRRMGRPAFRRPTSDSCLKIFGLVWLLLYYYRGADAPPPHARADAPLPSPSTTAWRRAPRREPRFYCAPPRGRRRPRPARTARAPRRAPRA